jgi:endonuclease/exonuclease/phosphatase family metal-dependent hydrolase
VGVHLRILSANLYRGRADPEAFAALVRDFGADVVAVQELGPSQAEALADVLPHGLLEPDEGYSGMGIAARRPAATTRVPRVERNARVARLEPCDWPELPRGVEIVNVHITAPHEYPFWLQPFRRRTQLEAVLSHVAGNPELPRAVVGDFNATPLWPVYRRFAVHLEDVVRNYARARGERPGRTWPRVPGGPLIRIDHCFASGLSAEHVETFVVPGSDHLALGVDLSVD